MRCFIAIDIPDNLKREIVDATKIARAEHSELKWVEEENLHITLKFLGEVEPSRVEKVKGALERVSRMIRPFSLSTSSFGTFPEKGALRVFWIGIEGDLDILRRLHELIDAECSRLGFAKEKREFTPHLTLARARRYTHERVTLEDLNLKELRKKPFRVNEIVLYQSILRPEGPVYKKLSLFRLRGR